MRAQEIILESDSQSLKQVVKTDQGVWYQVDPSSVEWYAKQVKFTFEKIPPHVPVYMFVADHLDPWDWGMSILMLVDQDLQMVHSGNYVKQNTHLLQALVDKVGAKTGTRIYGELIVYDGQVWVTHEVFTTMPQVSTWNTRPIYEVPASARWILNRLRLKYHIQSDKTLVFQDAASLLWMCMSIKNNKIVSVQSTLKLPLVRTVEISIQLAQLLGLKLVETTAYNLMPLTQAHKVLQAIQDNYQIARTHLYWGVLKLKKIPTHKGDQDWAHHMVSWGLVSKQETDLDDIRYSITPKGKMVLAALNAGKPVPLKSFIPSPCKTVGL
jgi:hypothetical protein